MAFVNEYVSEEEAKKYDLDGINRQFGRDPDIRYSWTIDRERNVFLMWIKAGREEFASEETFVLWWDGLVVPVYTIKGGGGRLSEKSTTIWRLRGIDLPSELTDKRDELIAVLKEALTEYKVFGIGVPVADHTAIFEF